MENKRSYKILTEVITSFTGKDLGDSYNSVGGTTLTQLIVRAMEQQAKEQSIRFAMWIGKNEYSQYGMIGDNMWSNWMFQIIFTTQELFELFLNQDTNG